MRELPLFIENHVNHMNQIAAANTFPSDNRSQFEQVQYYKIVSLSKDVISKINSTTDEIGDELNDVVAPEYMIVLFPSSFFMKFKIGQTNLYSSGFIIQVTPSFVDEKIFQYYPIVDSVKIFTGWPTIVLDTKLPINFIAPVYQVPNPDSLISEVEEFNKILKSEVSFQEYHTWFKKFLNFYFFTSKEDHVYESTDPNPKRLPTLKTERTGPEIEYITKAYYTKIHHINPFKVRGHFALRACGKGRTDRKVVFIDEYKKGGYVR